MARRPDLPRIRPQSPPSFFNSSMAKWGIWGFVAASVAAVTILGGGGLAIGAAAAMALGSILFPPFLPIAGIVAVLGVGASLTAPAALGTVAAVTLGFATVGAVKGKTRQIQEMVTGRTVAEPTLFNSGVIGGLFAGISANLALKGVAALAAKATAGGTLATIGTTAATLADSIGLFGLGTLALMAGGAIWRYNQMHQEFGQSLSVRNQYLARAQSVGMGQGIAPVRQTQVTPEDMALLAARERRAGRGASFTDQIQASRLAAMQQKLG